ncbi:MAG: hypothetical protein K0U47_02915 [Epsilonproteobacteria bacterium]|nr:hypothetical protein [Campylobacterota bacterium]
MIKSEDIVRIANYFTKIHHTPGRLRVRIDPAIKQEPGSVSVGDIEQLSQQIRGIDNLKINKLLGTATILYDKAVFENGFWEDLLSRNNLEHITQRLNQLAKEVNV